MPDLRLGSDRYLDLAAERAKADRLCRIAATTDLEGVARAYYDMTEDVDPRRCRMFLRHILASETRGEILSRRIADQGRVLELGCGTGGLALALRKRSVDVVAIDIASRWLVVAERRLKDAGLDAGFHAANAEDIPWPDASFDTVVADSLIEHLDDPVRMLSEARRVLRPGGKLLLWSPNRLTLLADPHVRLWGVGLLPRGVAKAYVRLRRGGAWLPRTLTAEQACGLTRSVGFVSACVNPPEITQTDLRTASSDILPLMKIYRDVQRTHVGRFALRWFGPVWEVVARKAA